MFSFRNDPGADGAGVAYCDAVAPDGGRLDLTLGVADGWRSPDWDLIEDELGLPALNAYQVHGRRVLTVDAATDAGLWQPRGPTTTTRPRARCPVTDCPPVLFADARRVVAPPTPAG